MNADCHRKVFGNVFVMVQLVSGTMKRHGRMEILKEKQQSTEIQNGKIPDALEIVLLCGFPVFATHQRL